jgi:hypothetical protein
VSSPDNEEIGVLVLTQFFFGADWDFVKLACFHEKSTSSISGICVKWHNPDQHPEGDMSFFSCEYTWLHPQKYKTTLLGIPHSLAQDFLLSDLQFPFGVAGCVLIVDLHQAFSTREDLSTLKPRDQYTPEQWNELQEKSPGAAEWIAADFEERLNFWRMGGIAWIRKNELPFVVVFIEPEAPAIVEDEMRELLELEPHIPVISCSSELNEDRVHISFDRKDIERVLLALVEQIEAEDL